MASAIGSIVRRATRRPSEVFNILSYTTHERYQSGLAKCNADFYLYQNGVPPGQQDFVKGGWVESYAEIPDNTRILSKWQQNPLEVIPSHVDIDIVFGQHRFGQGQQALQLANYFQCPTVILDHTCPTSDAIRAQIPQLREVRGDVNVFISKSSAEAWGWSLSDPSVEVVHHGVDTDLFKPLEILPLNLQPHVLCVVNDWINRGDILGYDIFQRVVLNNKLPVRVLGDTKGLSQPAPNVYELAKAYQHAAVFYNTSRHSPLPTVLIEAMSCGVPVVSTDNYLISEVVINGFNGYKTNSEAEQLRHLQRLLNDPSEREELGANARKTVLENFALEDFVNNWNRIFEKARKA